MGRLDLYKIEPSNLYEENVFKKYQFVADVEEIDEINDLIIGDETFFILYSKVFDK